MRSRECIRCEKMFDCKGKPNNNPCVSYVERKEEPKKSNIFDRLYEELINEQNNSRVHNTTSTKNKEE